MRALSRMPYERLDNAHGGDWRADTRRPWSRRTLAAGGAVLFAVIAAIVIGVSIRGGDGGGSGGGAPKPPAPGPPPLPPAITAAISRCDALASATEPSGPDSGYMPYIGNGFIATRVLSATVFLGGVFSGVGRETPSHRAAIPSPAQIWPVAADNQTLSLVEGVLHLRDGVYYRFLAPPAGACGGAMVEQAMFAHRTRRHLLLQRLRLVGDTARACTIRLHAGNASVPTPDFANSTVTATTRGRRRYAVRTMATALAECADCVRPAVAVAWDPLPASVDLVPGSAVLLGAAFSTSLEGGPPEGLGDAAVSHLHAAHADGAAALMRQHQRGWAVQWSGGVEVQGNATVARAANASLYYIRSSVREDWPYSLSPGGLSTDAYHGHSFWDCETWMLPAVMAFQPGVARSLLRYREQRVAEAEAKASSMRYKGALFPWESAFSGVEVTPAHHGNLEAEYEQHISGDIAVAAHQYYNATGNVTWLRESGWPLARRTCEFWASRVVEDPATGNYTAWNVQPPDESAGVVNDSVYTNAVASASMSFCVRAAWVLGVNVPARWADIAARPYLPVVTSIVPGREVHPEYHGYRRGTKINQADVALLQYPLGVGMPRAVALNDLNYYTSVTRRNGYFTGNSAYAIAYLTLGERAFARTQFESVFLHMDVAHFFVWKERVSGGHLNFITGAGGFLQTFMQGYAGMRWREQALIFQPQRPPPDVDTLTLRGVTVASATLDVELSGDGVRVLMTSYISREGIAPCLTIATKPGAGKTLLCGPGDRWPASQRAPLQPFSLGWVNKNS